MSRFNFKAIDDEWCLLIFNEVQKFAVGRPIGYGFSRLEFKLLSGSPLEVVR